MTALDADRGFALTQVPAVRREAVGALWRVDAALGAILAGGREPMIGRIKLAWWRDSLEALDRQKLPAEPILRNVAAHLLPRGIAGAELARMEEGWAVLLGAEHLTEAELGAYADARGGNLFRYSARLLGREASEAQTRQGEAWALADLARNSNRIDGRGALSAAARRLTDRERWPAELRPLGMLAMLARRDAERGLDRLEPPGVPPRVARMLRHRLTGR